MKRYILFLFASVIFITLAKAQSNNVLFMKPQVTPQAPNISSLGSFGNFPVGHYSGTTNLNIPFYEIDLDGMKIPIQLMYNSSGVKVDQESGWVGLGWSLQVGGTIAKEVRGWNDFGGNDIDYNKYPQYFFGKNPDLDPGYYFNDSPDFPPRNSNDEIVRTFGGTDHVNSDELLILNKLSNIDTQPDMFHFNFCSYSGTMYFDRKTKTGKLFAKPIVKNPKDYLDISYDINNSKWMITDSYGYKFYFGSTERTEVHDVSFAYPAGMDLLYPSATYDKERIYTRVKMPVVTTSWYIDSIVSPKGNKVTFHYDMELFSTPAVFTQVYLMKTTCRARSLNNNYSYSVHEQNILKRIEFNGGSILFNTSARKDMDNVRYSNSELSRGHTGIAPQKLDGLEIRNTEGNTIKKFNLEYSYMGDTNDYNSCRLVLNTVTEVSGNIKLKPYEFTYIQGTLPKKNSVETDLWGYYNGPLRGSAGNIVPTFIEATGNKEFTINGGKYAMPDFNYARIGTLSGVRYPTGGTSEFIYESPVVNTQYTYYSESKGTAASFRHIPYANPADLNILTFSSTFTLKEEAYVQVNSSYYYFENIPGGNYPDNYVSVWLRRVLPDGKKETVVDSNIIGFRLFGKSGDKKGNFYLLGAGTYELAGQKEPNVVNKYHFFVDAYSHSVKPEICNLGGGLRIREIQNYDKGNLISKKKFSYEAGVLLAEAEYLNLMRFRDTPLPIVCSPDPYSGYVSFDVSVNGKAPSDIGYRNVEETTEDSAGQTTGKTVYRFHAEQSKKISSMPGFPYEPDSRNGTLYETSIYNNKVSLIKKTELNYSIKLGQTDKLTEALFMYYGPHDISPGSKFYDLKSERWVLDSQTTTDYLNGNEILKSMTKYTYDPAYWTLTKTETSDSKNEKLEELSKYPFNFTDPVSVKMKNRNMVGVPVEKVALRNNLVVSGNKAIYYDSLGMYLPKIIQRLNIAKPESLTSYSKYFEEEFRFDKYDNKGNVISTMGKDNIPTVYLWSYNYRYLVAEIRNATSTDVETAAKSAFGVTGINALSQKSSITLEQLKNLRNHTLLKGAHVTTYTYKPLVGILTTTDPSGITTYYDYDSFGRLKEIYIMENNVKKVVQSYNYHYQNQ